MNIPTLIPIVLAITFVAIVFVSTKMSDTSNDH